MQQLHHIHSAMPWCDLMRPWCALTSLDATAVQTCTGDTDLYCFTMVALEGWPLSTIGGQQLACCQHSA